MRYTRRSLEHDAESRQAKLMLHYAYVRTYVVKDHRQQNIAYLPRRRIRQVKLHEVVDTTYASS